MAHGRLDPSLLADLAHAVRDRDGIRFHYGADEEPVTADPYRLVSWQQRWYVVARRRPTGEWQAFRADWIRLRTPGASRFAPEPLEGGDYAAYVLRDGAFRGWSFHARIAVDAPAELVSTSASCRDATVAPSRPRCEAPAHRPGFAYSRVP